MTDPIQNTNPINPQQPSPPVGQPSQQPYTDDILWEDNIFATIPEEEEIEEDDLPYGDILEKKYQFTPIPEEEIPAPIPSSNYTLPEEKIEDTAAQQELQNIQQQSWIEHVQVETLLDTKLQTDVQKKFGELFFTTKKIYELKNTLWTTDEVFDILWANNDKIFISYRFLIDDTQDPILFITKIEQNKETEEELVNELKFEFSEAKNSLEVSINDILLFDEIQDFTDDPKKKMQVIDKLNKFIFLTSEEVRKLEKEIKENEENEKERKKLQEVFRNF